MKLVIGLGNPGKEYAHTRHNAGFIALDTLANGEVFTLHKKSKAEIATLTTGEQKLILAKPQTFMNDSGQSVQALLDFYKLTVQDLIVVHDDIDIPLGKFRIQKDRGTAGHNGVSSIIEQVGTKDFWRIRIGIAPLEHLMIDTADFVLGKFTKDELVTLHESIDRGLLEIKKLF